MLKLKKVQILGFKSFCDRTEVQLAGQGIAAIVGPNGCGKSNISDAITWVLGEQSAKSLRGIKMEDVIFAGTRDRKATGMAEVSLTLVDPEVYDDHAHGPSFEGLRDERMAIVPVAFDRHKDLAGIKTATIRRAAGDLPVAAALEPGLGEQSPQAHRGDTLLG